MFTVQTRTEINSDPNELFDFVADQTNAPRWQQGLAEVRRVTPGPPRLGSEHVFVRRFAGRRLEARNRYTRYEPPQLVEFEIPEGWLSGRASYLVEPRPGGSVLISTMTFGTRGHGRAIEGVLRRLLAHDAGRNHARLKALLEQARPDSSAELSRHDQRATGVGRTE